MSKAYISAALSKKIAIIFLIIIGVFVCSLPFTFFRLVHEIRQFSILRQISLPEEAQFLFEDVAVYGGGSALQSRYYWSAVDVSPIRQFYAQSLGEFYHSADGIGEWDIGFIDLAGSTVERSISTTAYVTHASGCEYTDFYDCISVALAGATSDDWYRLAVMSPSGFRRSELPVAFSSVPKGGTVIVISYYVNDY